jgi:hypothetical protein
MRALDTELFPGLSISFCHLFKVGAKVPLCCGPCSWFNIPVRGANNDKPYGSKLQF